MKRKLVYLPCEYSKEMVDAINLYFDKGYELEDIFNADNGYYMLLVLKCNENYAYKHTSKIDLSDKKNINNLIEEERKWVKTSTGDIVFNTSTGDTLLN
jgi:hypothetical protein